MRPKKIILCVNSNENDLSVLKFLLVTNQYKVLMATCSQEAVVLFVGIKVDLVLATVATDIDEMAGVSLIEKLKQIAPFIPMVLIDNGKLSVKHGLHDGVINKNCTPSELLERIKIMTVRKRGPVPKNKMLDIKAQTEHTLSAGNI
jgi:two-component system, OmpR family, response regulator CpxR